MAKRVSGEQVLQNAQGEGGFDWKGTMVDLRPDKQSGKTIKRLRLIGEPIEFWQCTDRQRDPEDQKKSIRVPFPDAEINKGFTRVCDDDPRNCVWSKMGYIRTKQYAINCIDREDGKVKVLTKGSALFKILYEQQKENRAENDEARLRGEEDLLWEDLGGLEAPDVKITAVTNDKNKWGGIDYSVFFNPKVNRLTSEEIQALRDAGVPTAEKLEALKAAMPDTPEWAFYGHDLEKLYSPTPLRTEGGSDSTPSKELTLSNTDDDESFDDEPEVKKAPEKKSAKKSAKVEEVDDTETDVDTDDGAEEAPAGEFEW